MREKQAITRELAVATDSRQEGKSAILDQVADITGYNRCYAPCCCGTGVAKWRCRQSRVQGRRRWSSATRRDQQARPARVYDDKVVAA